MELNTIIPNSDINWIIKGDVLMYKKYSNIPVAYIDDDIVFIFLDLKIVKTISRLVEHLMSKNIEFYFDSPEFSNPAADAEEYNTKVITHYLYAYASKGIFNEFKRIDFDLIKNMTAFCDRNNCHGILKSCYDIVKKAVLRSDFDYYAGKTVWSYPEEIREEFENLYRDIQISRII